MSARRFPPLWTVEELDACVVIKDGAWQKPVRHPVFCDGGHIHNGDHKIKNEKLGED